jgi:hypothetical protein
VSEAEEGEILKNKENTNKEIKNNSRLKNKCFNNRFFSILGLN